MHRRGDHDGSSKMDTASMQSGFMSKAGGGNKKRSIRKSDQRSMKLAQQNETLINKIQEQLADLKGHVNGELSRLDGGIEANKTITELKFQDMLLEMEKNKVGSNILEQL